MKHPLLAVALCLSLSSCAWASQTVDQLIPSCQNKAYGLAAGYVTTGNIAHAYTGLPLCKSPKALPGNLCSDITVIRTIKAAENTAYVAIKSAEKVCTQSTLDAAFTAADAYKSIATIFTKPKP